MYYAVFDGHVGWQVSTTCKKRLHEILAEELNSDKMTESQVKSAIIKAFDRMEQELLSVARAGFENGFPDAAYAGACALIAVVHNNKLYVANAGDSKGVLLRQKCDKLETIKVSKTFSANKDYE